MDDPYLPDIDTLANQVINKTLLQLKKEKELYPFGTGAGMKDQIRMLALSFLYYKEVGIEQARELLIAAGTTFLDNINNKKEIRPFLQNYPFNPKNIEIAIFLKNQDGSELESGKLTIVSMTDGVLKYRTDEPQTYRLKTIYEENYDEAVAMLDKVAGF